ncbi:MAG: DNA mismatch repair protein MutS [Acidobacteriota bacterium]|nr:MAG: DNA mismatch repair protein MutS [Acidobacteriota bacterium]
MPPSESVTPMLRQYLEIKKQYPGTILFFRLGDFYEMFNEDAIVGSRELEITLTARHKDSPNPIPMCGVPYHSASGYIARLVRKGYRVAICEQTEAPAKGKKLVNREVVRVITPGTAIDPQLIESKETVYLASVCEISDSFGLAVLEMSSGNFFAAEFSGTGAWNRVCDQLDGFGPKELLFPADMGPRLSGIILVETPSMFGETQVDPISAEVRNVTGLSLEQRYFDVNEAERLLLKQFAVASLESYSLSGRPAAVAAAGACLRYVQETQKAAAEHIFEISYIEALDSMVLDSLTLRNLEIFSSRGDTSKGSLFATIDETVTGMGARLLKTWLQRPSLKRSEIQARSSAVAELGDSLLRDSLRNNLKKVADIDRLVGRINLGTATPRDVVSLRSSLRNAPQIRDLISDAGSMLLQVLGENVKDHSALVDLLERSINDEPPASVNDMGVIRDGFNAELDELRRIAGSVKSSIAEFEGRERVRTGIPNLKIRYNNVFNYYIEVSKANLEKVPDDYHRRQTLANAERYTTPQLKEWEDKVLNAEDRMLQLEVELFQQVKEAIRRDTRELQTTARVFATIDSLCSLAETAVKRNYVCPEIHDGDAIEIRKGRHPIVESALGDSFVSNDILLNNSTDRLLIITGANMGGKSTVLRQTALIQILAQIGSFVPASFARLPIVDRVWTRVGASDDLASGRSTFMVEMTETASILRNATPRSLVILDEIGRGTSTFDGMAIAWAVAEYLHNSPDHSAKTMFATHYHELTELADMLPGAKNYQMAATERENEVVFLHKLQPGKASKSYGIAVAKLAGLPQKVIQRADEVLEKLEKYELAVFEGESPSGFSKAAAGKAAVQSSLFAMVNEAAIDELRAIDIETLSSEESKKVLASVKSKIM